MNEPYAVQIDRIDRRIIDELSRDGRLSLSDLAARVGLSRTPCQRRIDRLRATGVILGFRAVIDPERLGRGHVAFVEVRLSQTSDKALRAFNAAVRHLPHVVQCHMIAGAFDYLLKVRCTDISEYRRVLGEQISALPHVASTSTHVAMETVKDRHD